MNTTTAKVEAYRLIMISVYYSYRKNNYPIISKGKAISKVFFRSSIIIRILFVQNIHAQTSKTLVPEVSTSNNLHDTNQVKRANLRSKKLFTYSYTVINLNFYKFPSNNELISVRYLYINMDLIDKISGILSCLSATLVNPAAYDSLGSIIIKNLLISANAGLNLTVYTNTNPFTSAQIAQNVASVTHDTTSSVSQVTANLDLNHKLICNLILSVGTINCLRTHNSPSPVARIPSTSTQLFYISVYYDGITLTNSLQFTIGFTRTSTADMTKSTKVISKNFIHYMAVQPLFQEF